jgi:hypothetical protein
MISVMGHLYAEGYFQVSMLRIRLSTSVFAFVVAAFATAVFRLTLWLMTRSAVLTAEDIPGALAFLAFYLFFVAIVWLGQRPHRGAERSSRA